MVWLTVGQEAWNHCSVTQLKPLCEASETVLVVVRSSGESTPSNAATHACRSIVGKLGWGCCGLLRPGETYATVSMYTVTAEVVTSSPHVTSRKLLVSLQFLGNDSAGLLCSMCQWLLSDNYGHDREGWQASLEIYQAASISVSLSAVCTNIWCWFLSASPSHDISWKKKSSLWS